MIMRLELASVGTGGNQGCGENRHLAAEASGFETGP